MDPKHGNNLTLARGRDFFAVCFKMVFLAFHSTANGGADP